MIRGLNEGRGLKSGLNSKWLKKNRLSKCHKAHIRKEKPFIVTQAASKSLDARVEKIKSNVSGYVCSERIILKSSGLAGADFCESTNICLNSGLDPLHGDRCQHHYRHNTHGLMDRDDDTRRHQTHSIGLRHEPSGCLKLWNRFVF